MVGGDKIGVGETCIGRGAFLIHVLLSESLDSIRVVDRKIDVFFLVKVIGLRDKRRKCFNGTHVRFRIPELRGPDMTMRRCVGGILGQIGRGVIGRIKRRTVPIHDSLAIIVTGKADDPCLAAYFLVIGDRILDLVPARSFVGHPIDSLVGVGADDAGGL